eukprot:SAG11_NODE_26217_length_348_cov_0.827309_1_plen_93_part_01
MSGELNEVFFRFPFQVPDYFALITKSLIVLEGIALVGDPEFDLFEAAYPYTRDKAVREVRRPIDKPRQLVPRDSHTLEACGPRTANTRTDQNY